jgi:hypothetical protein
MYFFTRWFVSTRFTSVISIFKQHDVHGADAVDVADDADVAEDDAVGNHAFHDNYYDNKICDDKGDDNACDNGLVVGDASVAWEVTVDDVPEAAVVKEDAAD